MSRPDRRPGRRAAAWKVAVLVAFVAAATLVVLSFPLPTVQQLRSTMESAGLLGAIAFIVGYAAITLTPVPKNVLSIAAGLIWGFGTGAFDVYLAALAGAAGAFFLGRWLGRDAVERFTGTRVASVDELLRRRGFLAVLGARLIPVIPFTVINYTAGLTAVRRRDYALGTAIGIIPGTLAYVAIGAFGLQLGWGFWVALSVLALLSIGGVLAGVRARRKPSAPTIEPDRGDDV